MTALTIAEVANRLKISTQMTRRLCQKGKIQARKENRLWLVDEYHLADFIKSYKPENKDVSRKPLTKKPYVLSFFSGAMGLDQGLELAGFQTLLASEIDNSARKTIQANKPDISLLGDIRNYSKEEIMSSAGLSSDCDVDVIAGGPPCQAFSTAGKRLGLEDERGNVFLKYLDLCFEIRPKYIVIENVRGLLSAALKHRPHDKRGDLFPPLKEEEQPGGVLHYIIRMIEDANYSYSFNLYNAANFGVPQSRERVIIICSRNGERVPFLKPTHSQNPTGSLKPWRTFREATEQINDHEHIHFPEKRLKYLKLLNEGENWRDLPEDLQPEALGKAFYLGGGKTGFLRRVAWDKPSPTLVTHPAMPATDLAHPSENRPLSVQEYMALQQFPESWHIEGKTLNKYKQLGNAVPVGLGEAIGKTILAHMEGTRTHAYEDFNYSRYKNTSDIDFRKKYAEEKQNILF
ncbi:DNA cytosine methyltransferase [Vreelandella aquamarina]|uniref:DNA cytosine methyltransferase n=1 Tax=Vreelandella aquamarina TaxID=77097 RepID=UPI00384F8CB7